MLEIRWHGRGGQGAVTASEVIASASIIEGKYALAFPEFGAERRGAPVRAYTRVTDSPLIPRTPIEHPDVVVVLDRSLLKPSYIEGLKDEGILVANSPLKPDELLQKLGFGNKYRAATVDATAVAMKWLKANIVNTAILGALVKSTEVVKLDTVLDVIRSRFHGKIAEANVMAVKEAYDLTQLSWR
ncbi:2-oxoacid:acceptor oxidoreductase family protein [Acidilobus sp.]|jgi:pyruvate ferredoxin oxidoreductase gamma subunit|uniref:2-oxoacid:acceptor oxidoreductase family protein n=1 Tax=Acidilobus sp. TaxID=1872109 RepID=UPI003D006C97